MEQAVAFILSIALILGLSELREWRERKRARKLSLEISRLSRKVEASERASTAASALVKPLIEDAASQRELVVQVKTALETLVKDYEIRIRRDEEQMPDYITG